jgi:flagellar motility protein MotE (MotC chaperone)
MTQYRSRRVNTECCSGATILVRRALVALAIACSFAQNVIASEQSRIGPPINILPVDQAQQHDATPTDRSSRDRSLPRTYSDSGSRANPSDNRRQTSPPPQNSGARTKAQQQSNASRQGQNEANARRQQNQNKPAMKPELAKASSPESSGQEAATTQITSSIAGSSALTDSFCKAVNRSAENELMIWQTQRLETLRAEIEIKLQDLDARQKIIEQAEERQKIESAGLASKLVAIIAKMRPDAAAAQIAEMPDATAARIIARLDPKSASLILNEVTPAKAARIADTLGSPPNGTKH